MEQKEFDLKLKEKYPNEKYTILYYGNNSKENTVIKCLSCGRRIEVNTGELFRNRRKHICSKCNYKRKDTEQNEDAVRKKLENTNCYNIEFYMEDSRGIRHHMVHYNCGKCDRLNVRRVSNFLRQTYNCNYCEGQKECKDTDIFNKQLYEKFGASFTLLSEYTNTKTNIKVRCNNCGFIRSVKPAALLNSGYCPKCGVKSSKGEKVIADFLTEHLIEFEVQKYFKEWGIGMHYFDFYIPQFNLVLEYNGRQHYEFIDYFHKDIETFKLRQEKDKIKKTAALTNDLNFVSIKYTLYNNLNSILEYIFNSTTIPQGSRGKCLEIETIQNLDEDIVCSLLKDKEEK